MVLGVLLGWFWDAFGMLLGCFGDVFGMLLGSFWDFGGRSGIVWEVFGHALGMFCACVDTLLLEHAVIQKKRPTLMLNTPALNMKAKSRFKPKTLILKTPAL